MIYIHLLLRHIPLVLLIYLTWCLNVAIAASRNLVALLDIFSHELIVMIAAHLGIEGAEVVLSHGTGMLMSSALHLVTSYVAAANSLIWM